MESTTQIFLRIALTADEDTLRGEGRIDKYASRIQIDSFDFSMKAKKNTVRRSAEEVSANIDFHTVHVSKPFDRASTNLANMVYRRTKFEEARITVDQQMTWGQFEEREQNAIIVFHFLHGYVVDTKLRVSESGKGASVREDIELSFKNFAVEYYLLNKSIKDGVTRNYREIAVPFATNRPEQD